MSSYFDRLRRDTRVALNQAPASYRTADGVRGKWLPFDDHLLMPEEVLRQVVHGRKIEAGNRMVWGDNSFGFGWKAVELVHHVRVFGDLLPHAGRRKQSSEETLFWLISPDGTKDYLVLLQAEYMNEGRASERFSLAAYTATPSSKPARLEEVTNKQLGQLFDQHHDWFDLMESFFRSTLKAIRHHHTVALGQVDGTLEFMARQIKESTS